MSTTRSTSQLAPGTAAAAAEAPKSLCSRASCWAASSLLPAAAMRSASSCWARKLTRGCADRAAVHGRDSNAHERQRGRCEASKAQDRCPVGSKRGKQKSSLPPAQVHGPIELTWVRDVHSRSEQVHRLGGGPSMRQASSRCKQGALHPALAGALRSKEVRDSKLTQCVDSCQELQLLLLHVLQEGPAHEQCNQTALQDTLLQLQSCSIPC